MTNMTFDDEMGRLQRALAQCEDMVVRRSTVLDALNLRAGDRVLEVGCGGGFYVYECGRLVGATGRVTAIDLSAEQIAATRNVARSCRGSTVRSGTPSTCPMAMLSSMRRTACR
jgi:ubiquinone/menaquinone biosynthesis C-methylase UbiE